MDTCGHCGQPVATEQPHPRCEQMLAMEPPRFCVECARRMKVQVHPRGWSATCVEHGTLIG
ncbi:hypothetical protein GCM10027270_05490 [Nocardioides ginkgobilobae]